MNTTPLEDQVRDALHRAVDPLHHAPLSVTDVRRRARRIHRRRVAVTGVGLAAALAIAVPVGLSVGGSDPRGAIEPATEPATETPAPVITGTITIDPRRAPAGDPTTITLIDVVAPSVTVAGETTELPRYYDQIVAYLDGWIAVANNEGALTYQQLSADFEVVDQASPVTPLVVSQDRTRLAFAQYDTDHWSVVDLDAGAGRSERRTPLPPGPEVASVRVVGFLPDDGLLVAQTDPSGGEQSAIVVAPDGTTSLLSGFIKPTSSSSATGLVTGQTSSTADTSCSRASDPRGTVAWETCDNSLGEFSPDGQHLAGYAASLDGSGSPTLSILDATTGEPVVDFDVAGGGSNRLSVINPEVAWEDDAHLVTTVVTGNRQYVVRLGLDGTVERLETEVEDPTLNPLKVMP